MKSYPEKSFSLNFGHPFDPTHQTITFKIKNAVHFSHSQNFKANYLGWQIWHSKLLQLVMFTWALQLRDCAIIIRRGGRGAEKLELSSKNLDSTPSPKPKKFVLTPLCYVKNNVAPLSHHPDLDKAFAKYRGAYHIGSKCKTSEARKRKEQRKNQWTGDWTLQITDEKELALYLDPWEESLLNFVISQIYMEFNKSIHSMKKHYFYSHQKPTKLVYEIFY